MGLLNSIFKWVLLERMPQIEAFTNNPVAIQDRILHDLLEKGSSTEYGRGFNITSSGGYESFKRSVPVNDYNSLKSYIERTMNGEQNVLWPSPINWFAKSSGTTDDKSKFIPVSKESLYDCHFKAGKDMYALYYSMYPDADLGSGKSLVIGGSHQVHKVNESVSYGDLSAVLMQNLPFWAELKRVPDLSIALMDNWEHKLELMADETMFQNVTNLLGVPTWTIILLRKILEKSGKSTISELWPNLELYVHGGVSFKPYREIFEELIGGSKMRFMETYNASEGFFAIQDTFTPGEMLLMLDYGIFYEFIPSDTMNLDEAVPLEGVVNDKNYAVVVTTNGGLWRYLIGDTVKFVSKNPYRICITGRTKHFINAFGEELVIENAEKALTEACQYTNSKISDYTAAPVYFSSGTNGAHEWVIEFEQEPGDVKNFAHHLDEMLKTLNSDYEAKRFKDIALGPPLIRVVPRGTFYEWMKKRGKLGGQNKVPRLSNHRQYVDEILNLES